MDLALAVADADGRGGGRRLQPRAADDDAGLAERGDVGRPGAPVGRGLVGVFALGKLGGGFDEEEGVLHGSGVVDFWLRAGRKIRHTEMSFQPAAIRHFRRKICAPLTGRLDDR